VDQKNPVTPEIVEEVARDFDLHVVDPTQQAPAQPLAPAFPPTANGEQPPLIESLLQALNTLVDRLNQAESATATVESEQERKP